MSFWLFLLSVLFETILSDVAIVLLSVRLFLFDVVAFVGDVRFDFAVLTLIVMNDVITIM
jgi:hypothetical protein